MAFDRNTGATVWSKPGIPFNQPVIDKSLVYSICSQDSYYPSPDSLWGLYAFDVTTGNEVWKRKSKIYFEEGSPYIASSKIFHCGMLGSGVQITNNFIKGYSTSAGNEVWNTNTGMDYGNICMYPVVMGNRVYAFKNSTGTVNSRIVFYDASTGQAKDSILLTGESFGKLFIVGSLDKVYTPN